MEPLREHEQQYQPQPEHRHGVDEQRNIPDRDVAEPARPYSLIDPEREAEREVDEQRGEREDEGVGDRLSEGIGNGRCRPMDSPRSPWPKRARYIPYCTNRGLSQPKASASRDNQSSKTSFPVRLT